MKARVFQDNLYLERNLNTLLKSVKVRFVVGLKDSLVVIYDEA